MKRINLITTTLLLSACGTALAQTPSPRPNSTATGPRDPIVRETATITAISGTTILGGTTTQDSSAMQVGAQLSEGSQITTGADGSVTLTLADGSVVTLQKSSTLTLSRLRRDQDSANTARDTNLRLESGRVQTQVHKQTPDSRYEISTPVAISSVRGTKFRVSYDPASTSGTTETLEGRVAVSNATTALEVPAGYGTREVRGALPTAPSALLPAPDLAALPDTNEDDRLRLRWPAVANATSYRVQLATDEHFNAMLNDQLASTPQVDLPAPANGAFWIRVHPIDAQGLEGRDAARQLTQHLLPPPPLPITPQTDATLPGLTARLSWSDSQPDHRYRVQVARDPAFAELLLDRQLTAAQMVTLTPQGQYWWRVSAVNPQGENGKWSTVASFHQNTPVPVPAIPVFKDQQMTLAWTAEPGMQYRVQIASDAQFHNPLLDQQTGKAEITLKVLRPATWYARVQVIAPDGQGNTSFSTPRSFKTPTPWWLWFPLAAPVTAAAAPLM